MAQTIVTKPKRSRLNRFTITDVIIYALLGFLSLTMLYAFLNLVWQSISPAHVISEANGILLYPKEINFEAYKYMINYRNVWLSYRNTIFVTVVGTINSLIWTGLGGYALSRRDMPGRTAMTLFVVFTMYFGGGLIPTYLNLRRLGFLNTLWVMIIPDAISTGYLLYFRNFFMSLPNELKESAYIDGAGELTTFIKIILPMSAPIFATMALFYGVSNWNEYSTPLLYNSKQEYWTIQVIIQRMYNNAVEKNLSEGSLDRLPPTESIKAAAVVFCTLPILCVYPFLQKYFAKGIMVGSLKG